MNKHFIQARIAELRKQLDDEEKTVQQHLANVQAIHGALQECSHHLSEISKAEHADSLLKAAQAEEDARVKAGVEKFCDDVSKLGDDV